MVFDEVEELDFVGHFEVFEMFHVEQFSFYSP